VSVSPVCTEHPRLLFDRDRLARLRARIQDDGPAAALWSEIAAHADALLQKAFVSEAEADGPDTQHGNYGRPSGQIADMGLVLGVAYQVTGEPRYAEKLREALLHYARYQKWYGRGLLRNDPPWHSELNTARFCFGFAVGYDCIHDVLTADLRAEIAGAVTRLGILPTLDDWVLPEKRVHALDSMGHNWWSVCVAQAGLAALAVLGEEPRAEGWVEAAADALDLWFDYRGNPLQNKSPNFDVGGAFYESVNYANYGLAEYLLFRLGYAHTMGDAPRMPLLERAGAFFLHTCYPTSAGLLTVNFGDGDLHADAGRAAALLLLNGYEQPELRWYAQRARRPEGPLALLSLEGASAPRRPDGLGRSALYPDIGWAVLRSSWADDATLLAVKSGFTWNHAHADAGSFVLFHGGKPLIIDSGNCSYGRAEYHGYYCQSRAHNVVLFNGRGQPEEDLYRGSKHPGGLHHLIEWGDLQYLGADATGPMAQHFSRNYRHFLWVGDVLLVLDDIRAHESGRIEWLLHHGGEAASAGGADLRIADGDAHVTVRPLFPPALTIDREEGLADHRPEEKVSYLSFAVPEETREAKFLTGFLLSSAAEVEGISGDEWLGARLRQGGRQTDVYLNLRADGRRMHRNSNHAIEGWETDAALLALTHAGGALERYFLAGGSYLRRDGRVLLDSLSKALVAFTAGPERVEVRVEGQPRIHLSVGAPARPETVKVNGRPAAFAWDAEGSLVRLRGGDATA